eukprot:scaffold63763_cov42-Tisochrysis_lutea.AAC.1
MKSLSVALSMGVVCRDESCWCEVRECVERPLTWCVHDATCFNAAQPFGCRPEQYVWAEYMLDSGPQSFHGANYQGGELMCQE